MQEPLQSRRETSGNRRVTVVTKAVTVNPKCEVHTARSPCSTGIENRARARLTGRQKKNSSEMRIQGALSANVRGGPLQMSFEILTNIRIIIWSLQNYKN